MTAKDRILARRAKFLAAAAAATVGAACSSSSEVCLSIAAPEDATSETAADASVDTRPQACLSPEPDTSVADTAKDAADTSVSDTSGTDTGPLPCLVPPLDSGM